MLSRGCVVLFERNVQWKNILTILKTHCAGIAKDFKIEGTVSLTVTWLNGQTLDTGAQYTINN